MKFNPKLKKQTKKFQTYIVLVEGNKSIQAFKNLGYDKVYAIHQTAIPLRERLETISKILTKKDKVCILTDFDKKGKQLYLQVKKILQELNVKIDSTLRGILLKSGMQHIEEINNFADNIENID